MRLKVPSWARVLMGCSLILSAAPALAHRDPSVSRELYQRILDRLQVALPAPNPNQERIVFQATGDKQSWVLRATRWVMRKQDCPRIDTCVILEADPVHNLLLDVLTDMEDLLAETEHHCGAHCSHGKSDSVKMKAVLQQTKIEVGKIRLAVENPDAQAPLQKVHDTQANPKHSGGIATIRHLASDLISLPPRIFGFAAYGGLFGAVTWGVTELLETTLKVHLFCTVNIAIASLIPNSFERAKVRWKLETLLHVSFWRRVGGIFNTVIDKKSFSRTTRRGTLFGSQKNPPDGIEIARFQEPSRIPSASMIRSGGLSIGSVVSDLWERVEPLWKWIRKKTGLEGSRVGGSKANSAEKFAQFTMNLRRLEVIPGDPLWADVLAFDHSHESRSSYQTSDRYLSDEIIAIGEDPDLWSRIFRTERLTAVLTMMTHLLGDRNEAVFHSVWDMPRSEALKLYGRTFGSEWGINEVRKTLQQFRHALLGLAYQDGEASADLRAMLVDHFNNGLIPLLQVAGENASGEPRQGAEQSSITSMARATRQALNKNLRAWDCRKIAEGVSASVRLQHGK
jgi:hypothetical protein